MTEIKEITMVQEATQVALSSRPWRDEGAFMAPEDDWRERCPTCADVLDHGACEACEVIWPTQHMHGRELLAELRGGRR